jgi:lysozyme
MRSSPRGIKLLHDREGCVLTAYKDTVGVWTIGYGMTFFPNGAKVKQGDKITQKQADDMFATVLENDFEKPLEKLLVGISLNQDQYDALVSFAYNLGVSALSTSTLLRHLKAGKFRDANKQFARWVFPVEITSRRKAESRQFAGIEFLDKADLDPLVGWL